MLTLNFVISSFQTHWQYLIFGLPFLAMAFAYFETFQKRTWFGSSETIIAEIKTPRKHVHWLLAPWIFASTLLFHLFGASVGRESTAIQIGGSLAETLGRSLKIPADDRPIFIRMGLAAGFGAAFGVPWAGMIFGIESPLLLRKKDLLHLPFLALCSWGSYRWAHFLGMNHIPWKNISLSFSDLNWFSYFQLGLYLILLTLSYEMLFRSTQKFIMKSPWWARSGFAGLLILLLTFILGSPTFNNLGTPLIESSFNQTSQFAQALTKLVFTLISTVSGMKGGEVTPLMSAGALFGSWFAGTHSSISFQIGAALGLVSLFCSRLRIPLTGIFMLIEIFNWQIALLAAPILILTEIGQRIVFDRSVEESKAGEERRS